MASNSVPAGNLIRATSKAVRERLVRGRIDQMLVTQAKRRIDRGGDSTHKYPNLWADKVKGHYRSGGQPLRDTGLLYNALTSRSRRTPRGLKITLQHPRKYPVFHQHGFSTKGPNFIPFTRKAARNANTFTRLMGKLSGLRREERRTGAGRVRPGHGRSRVRSGAALVSIQRAERAIQQELKRSGLVAGKDYMMAWRGVTVPQRKIFNTPPEDVRELAAASARMTGGRRRG